MPHWFHALLDDSADARVSVVLQVAKFPPDRARFVFVKASDYQVVAGSEHALSDRSELRRGLTLAENNFRHAAAKAPVAVDLREAEILERQLAEDFERRKRSHPAGRNLVQQIADSPFSHLYFFPFISS